MSLQQLRVALLLVPGAALQAHDQLALDQPLERVVDLAEIHERVHPLGALLELARRLRPAEHQHADHRLLG